MSDRLRAAQHVRTRTMLRVGGIALLLVGGVMTLIGIGSFFSSFGSFGSFGSTGPFGSSFQSVGLPRYFWCAFVGLPLLAAGGALVRLGFLGSFYRYVAGESAPVAKDVVNYLGENTQQTVKTIAKAVTEGIEEGLNEEELPKPQA